MTSPCPKCATVNPPGSKFCAGCGAALPRTPVSVRCAACGAESPEGSRFCKACGKPLGAASGPQGPTGASAGKASGGPASRPTAPGEALQRVKTVLGGGAGLYALAAFLMYSELSRIRAVLGPYAGRAPGMGFQWLLIILDVALAAGNIYAISLAGKNDFKYARWLLAAMVGLGAIFFLRGLSGPVIFLLINAAMVAGGVYGWRQLSRVERDLSA